MKTIAIITLNLLSLFSLSQKEKLLKICNNNKEPIVFANVSINNSNYGTYSNLKGNVVIKACDTDTIIVSCIGYETIHISNIYNIDTVFLNEKVTELLPFNIKASYSHKKLGFLGKKTLRGSKLGNMSNVISGIKIENKKICLIESVEVFINNEVNEPKNLLILHIYNIKDSLPNQSLLDSILIIPNKGKGWAKIDLSELQIIISNDFYIGVESVPNYYSDSNNNLIDMKEQNIIYIRSDIKKDNWKINTIKGRNTSQWYYYDYYSFSPMIRVNVKLF